MHHYVIISWSFGSIFLSLVLLSQPNQFILSKCLTVFLVVNNDFVVTCNDVMYTQFSNRKPAQHMVYLKIYWMFYIDAISAFL